MANLAKFSEHGLNKMYRRVDIDALSDRAKRWTETRRVVITTAAGQKQTAVFVINTTTKHNLGPVGQVATLKAAYISAETAPAGGTLDWQLVAYDASANAEVILTDTSTDPETITVREAQAQVLATTNVELAADDTVELHCIASNNAVTQDAQGVSVTLVWQPTEETTLTE
jgi:hypothetical protein